jgi:hypothetical protein
MSLLNPKTLKIYLPDGKPNGYKKVQLSNWTGLTYVIPRSELNAINTIDDLSKQCVYFLIGGTADTPELYIGEAENFKNRIVNHHTKDFWNTCIIIISKDDNLTKSHIKFLEAQLIADAKSLNIVKLHNANNPISSKLPEEDESEMNEFKSNINFVLSALRYTFLEISISSIEPKTKYYLETKNSKLKASGYFTSDGLTLLEGSQVSKVESNSIHKYMHDLRSLKIEEGVLIEKDNFYEVNQKINFSSLSTAAGFVLGRAANGWTEWKDKSGKTLDEIERKSLDKTN